MKSVERYQLKCGRRLPTEGRQCRRPHMLRSRRQLKNIKATDAWVEGKDGWPEAAERSEAMPEAIHGEAAGTR